MSNRSGRGIKGMGSTSRTNQPAFMVGAGGGYLGSSGNRGTDRSIQINAATNGKRNNWVFHVNQLNGIGSRFGSMFASNADGVRTRAPGPYRV